MFRRTTLLLLGIFSLCVSTASAQLRPQYDDARIVRIRYENTTGERGTTALHYRRDGALAAEFWTLDDGSRWSDNRYVLNAAGLPVEKHRAFSDSLASFETFTYDGLGRRLAETFERSDGKSGAAAYEWGGDGRLLAADCDNWKGWLSGRIEYEYASGRLVSATLIRGEQTIAAIAYEYDGAAHLESETWDFGGRFGQTFRYEYEPVPERIFDTSSPLMNRNPRFRVATESYDFNGEGGGPSRYEYGADGRLSKKVFERSDGLRTETTYVFDERGALLSSHRAYHDGRTADFVYEYDDAQRLAGKTFHRSDGAEGFEKYAYDRLGRLESAEYRNMDFWLNGEITFVYDDRGRLDSGRFESSDGYSAHLDITADAERNVTRVHWRFDRGFTQTYEFGYEPVTSEAD